MAIVFSDLSDEDKFIAINARIAQLEEEEQTALKSAPYVSVTGGRSMPTPLGVPAPPIGDETLLDPERYERHMEKIKEVREKKNILIKEMKKIRKRLSQP